MAGPPRLDRPARTLITTEGLPDGERYTYFRQAMNADPSPVEIRCEDPASFSGWIDSADLGSVHLVRMRSRVEGRRELLRGETLIRRSDPEAYRLIINRGRPSTVTHSGRQVTLSRGDMMLVDTSQPLRGWNDAGSDQWVWARIHRSLLPMPGADARALVGGRLGGTTGVGGLLSRLICQAARDIETYRPADAVRVSTAILDLLAALLAHELDIDFSLGPALQQQTLMRRAQAFVEQHLPDPGLSPSSIAAAHHISTRTLHTLFREQGLTVSGWIRTRRLEQCRRDLADPRLAAQSVHAIAKRWGFTDAAHFSRTFKAAFGLGPQDYRKAMLNG